MNNSNSKNLDHQVEKIDLNFINDRTLRSVRLGSTGSTSTDSYGILPIIMPYLFAEAWVPINPKQWIPYYVASIKGSSLIDPTERFQELYYKLMYVHQYLSESASPEQFEYRAANVFYDWVIFNFLLEIDPIQLIPVPFLKGFAWLGTSSGNNYLLKSIQKYQLERIESLPLNSIELSNIEMFKDVGELRGANRKNVVGTGVFGQNIPEILKPVNEPFPKFWTLPPVEKARPKIFGDFQNIDKIVGDRFYDPNIDPLPSIFEKVQLDYEYNQEAADSSKFLKFIEKCANFRPKKIELNIVGKCQFTYVDSVSIKYVRINPNNVPLIAAITIT